MFNTRKINKIFVKQGQKCKEVTFPPIAEVQTEKGMMNESSDSLLDDYKAQNNLKVKLGPRDLPLNTN